MNRIIAYRTPQFIVFVTGLVLLVTGILGLRLSTSPVVKTPKSNNRNTQQLQVKPTRQQPTSTIDQLQGARGIQGQSSSNLQQSSSSDQLQRNAKTDTLPQTKSVQ